jgi:tungstate transport system substrate-binding protein
MERNVMLSRRRKYLRGILSLVLLSLLSALPVQAENKQLLLATTTSTDNTGLLDYLAPIFTRATTIELKWVATGTGKALKLGENCDADVLLVHAPLAEKKYVERGFGINRQEIMYNDFVIIGPPTDPASIKNKELQPALQAIHDRKALFVSRGDNSGTNKKEITLWKEVLPSVPEKESWYLQTGQGMLSTINVAAERGGYTMTDRGTYIKYEENHKASPPLIILVEGDKGLFNQYSVLEINPERCPKVKNDLARQFSSWMVGVEAQRAIDDFRLMGKQLFIPNAVK